MKFVLRYSDIIKNIHQKGFIDFFKALISQVNKVYVLVDEENFEDIKNVQKQGELAKKYEKRLKKMGFPLHRVILFKGENMNSFMNRNHFDVLLTSSLLDEQEVKSNEFVQWFNIDSAHFETTKNQVEQLLQWANTPILSGAEERTDCPSKDSIWLQYYNQKAMQDLRRFRLDKCTIWEHISSQNRDFLYDVAIDYYGKKITYADLRHNVERFQKAFIHTGVKEGDKVSLCVPNVPAGIYAYYALQNIGAIPCPLHVYSSEQEMKFYFDKENIKFVLMIGMQSTYQNVKKAMNGTNVQKVIVVPLTLDLDGKKFDSFKTKAGVLLLTSKFGNFLTHLPNSIKKYKLKRHDKPVSLLSQLKCLYNQTSPAFKMPDSEQFIDVEKFLIDGEDENLSSAVSEVSTIIHTGGTGGTGKSTLLSHDNINANDDAFEATIPDFEKGDTIIAIPPLFHILGLNNCITLILRNGGKVVLISKYRKKELAKLFKIHHPEVFFGVPKIGKDILQSKKFKEDSFHHLKYYVLGGEEMPPQFIEESSNFLWNHGANIDISQSLGGTEGSCSYTNTFENCNVHGSIGIPLINLTAKIIKSSEDGVLEEANYGEVGEICFHGESIMMGYLNDPKATAEALREHDDGKMWLHTGDCGYIDSDGRLFFCDRIKNMYKINGEQVYPSEIKKVVAEHPYVRDCAAYCIENEIGQKRMAVAVILKDGVLDQEIIKKEIMELCIKSLRRESIPSVLEIRDNLPETKLFKLDINALEKEYTLSKKKRYYQS